MNKERLKKYAQLIATVGAGVDRACVPTVTVPPVEGWVKVVGVG